MTADPHARPGSAADSGPTTLTWYDTLTEAQVTEITALLEAASAADGATPVDESALPRTGRTSGGAAALLARDPDTGELAGYAVLTPPPGGDGATATGDTGAAAGAELVVRPAHRRRGIGAALVAALVARSGGRPPNIWSHVEHPGAEALAARTGYRGARALIQMWRHLRDPFPEPEPPPGVTLRAFRPGADDAEFLRVNNAAFDWHPEQGGWRAEQLREREAEPWFDAEGFLLAVPSADPDHLLGYHWTKVHPDGGRAGGPIGEVYVLGVDPAEHGHKLGGVLTLAGLAHLRGRGLDEIMLYVESDNGPARAVYRRLGFTDWHTHTAYARDA